MLTICHLIPRTLIFISCYVCSSFFTFFEKCFDDFHRTEYKVVVQEFDTAKRETTWWSDGIKINWNKNSIKTIFRIFLIIRIVSCTLKEQQNSAKNVKIIHFSGSTKSELQYIYLYLEFWMRPHHYEHKSLKKKIDQNLLSLFV